MIPQFMQSAHAESFSFSIYSGRPHLTFVNDVAVDSGGNIFATTSDEIVKLSPTGTELWRIGSKGSGNGQFDGPLGIALDSSGNIYVADEGNERIEKFNSDGSYQSQFGSFGSGDGKFNSPDGVAIDSSGNFLFQIQVTIEYKNSTL